MTPTKLKSKVIAGAAVLLAVGFLALITGSLDDYFWPRRLKLPTGSGTPAVSLGGGHGLILASDGSLWSWGSEYHGWAVLGLGGLTNRSVSLRRIGNENDWVSISASFDHNLAIKSDGTIWTWGYQGRFCKFTETNAPVPAAPGNDWKQAAAGGVQFVALKQDGSLWAWGDNWSGALGVGATNGSAVPLQVGSATNWVKVWAGTLETVALQSDGSLWYWGENPNPAFPQGINSIFTPMRMSPDTNWVDVGFGPYTTFAIKSDGTLWTWGRHAHNFTGAGDQAQDAIPTRVGTDSDWRSVSARNGGWGLGLIKRDGSLWTMDSPPGSEIIPRGPRSVYHQVRIQRAPIQKDCVAYAASRSYGAPLGVVLASNGEVWTWGTVLGDPPTFKSRWQAVGINIAREFNFKITPPEPGPVLRDKPWRLQNIEPGALAEK